MRRFEYRRADTIAEAVELGAGDGALFLAGGTEVVPWLAEGVAAPRIVVDVSRIDLAGIDRAGEEIRIGAGARLADVAEDRLVATEAPGLVAAIESAASPAIRATGTLAGNLLQRTRCPYFRGGGPCNKRAPGSGCGARAGDQRASALFGLTAECVAAHPSDPAVALTALDARLVVAGPSGERELRIADLYPHSATAGPDHRLSPGELITEVRIPCSPLARSGAYRKLRERAAFDFAVVSAAALIRVERGIIAEARIAWGGIGPGPVRGRRAEALLTGRPFGPAEIDAAIVAELAGAAPLPGAAFKIELAAALGAGALLAAGARS